MKYLYFLLYTYLQSKCGLSALLPAPMHKASKESNRILLPYTLKKKPEPVVKPTKTVTKPQAKGQNLTIKSKFSGLSTEYSDSDEDESESTNNFFSLGNSNPQPTVGPALPDPSQGCNVGPEPLRVPRLSLPPPTVSDNKSSDIESNQLSYPSSSSAVSKSASQQDAPLVFKNSIYAQDAPLSFKSATVNSSANVFSNYKQSDTLSNDDIGPEYQPMESTYDQQYQVGLFPFSLSTYYV